LPIGGRGASLDEKGGRILLFLKKKKQKDFLSMAPRLAGQRDAQMDKSFLVLFFKKEHPC